MFNINLPRITGFSSVASNIGEIANNGWELSLSSVNVKTGNFQWDTKVIFSTNKNKIVTILGRDDDGDGIEDDLIANGLFIGEAIEAIYDYTVDGMYQIGDSDIPAGQHEGQYRIKNLNPEDGDDISAEDDRSIIGYTEPAYRFSIYNELRYKNFTFGAFINSVQGGKNGYMASTHPNSGAWDDNNVENWNIVREWDYWTPSNPDAKYQGIRYNAVRGEKLYQQRSFVRLQDVKISYDLPSNLFKRYSIDRVKVFISGKNLYTWTNWDGTDPEANLGISPGNIPVMKSYTFGINLNF